MEFEPYLSTPLPSARQSAVTTSYEPIAPDASDAESPRKARPIFDFSTVANPQDRGWLQKGFKHLREAKLGPLWDGVVDAFYEHEELMEFEVCSHYLIHLPSSLTIISLRISSTG